MLELGKEVVVMVGLTGATIVMVNDLATDVPAVLVAVREKLKAPAILGVPEMTPVLVFSASPPGRLFAVTAQVIVPPPEAASVWL